MSGAFRTGAGASGRAERRFCNVVAALCVAALCAAAGIGAGAPSAAATTKPAKHAASTGNAKKPATQRIGPLPKSLRDLPGARNVLYDYATHRAVGWWQKAAPCPGPRGRTLRPESVTRLSVNGGHMRGWCPLHAGDVLMYVPNADSLTPTAMNFTLTAGTVVHGGYRGAGVKVSFISTGAQSFTITPAVAKALREAYTTMNDYDYTAWDAVFTSHPPVAPARLPQRLAREYVDPRSPYYAQVAKGGTWYCTIPRAERPWVTALSGAQFASIAGIFGTPRGHGTMCAAYRHMHVVAPGSGWATAEVPPATGYLAGTTGVVGFYVETNRKRTKVYRVWVPHAAQVSLDAPWFKGLAHYVYAFTSGWAELRPSRPTAEDPRTMQIWQPTTGMAVWPSSYLFGWGARPRPYKALCTSPLASATIVLADGDEGPAPTVPYNASRTAVSREVCAR